ncbi:predicted protein [Sclerotinia sclerotiorum 1980 UF-70]|uniref:Uncharacterized protein n=1 Tax=Sclerotinia sclerotiorum (strain ATCC 18683 / 1980 / Ss-1) TaxID=665079 RepID=A7EZD2_SCLS1|nr:predicted protein [Sclerotinia sclerotiorum 1980 UF-70]EDN94824.1 predicted protein [Sclerotinia sclerotiorum 1980 UF-70]
MSPQHSGHGTKDSSWCLTNLNKGLKAMQGVEGDDHQWLGTYHGIHGLQLAGEEEKRRNLTAWRGIVF